MFGKGEVKTEVGVSSLNTEPERLTKLAPRA